MDFSVAMTGLALQSLGIYVLNAPNSVLGLMPALSSVAYMTLHARAGFRWATLLLACLTLPSAGCSPRLDPETYGEVVHTLPEVPGAEEPFPLPELTQGEPPETAPK